MASQPSANDEINVERRNQVEQQLPQQLQQPQHTGIHGTEMSRASSSHSQSSNQSNRISPGTTESQVPLTRTPVVSFPNFRDTSAATLGSPERLELDVPFPAYNPADGRMSRHPTMRVPNGEHGNSRQRASDLRRSTLVSSEDWINVTNTKWMYPPVEMRLEKTLQLAVAERNKSQLTARIARLSMLFVAGAQVLLGALTTGLSALHLTGQNSALATTALGILSTLSGASLAHVRATQEPEKSLMRIQRLDAFIRQMDAFILDYGDDTTDKYKSEIHNFRHEFELILAEGSPLSTSRRPVISLVEDKMKLVSKDASV